MELNRSSYGFEIDKKFYREAKNKMLSIPDPNKFKEITMDDYINTL